MKEDFLLNMGSDGVTDRLKRLSDLFVYQTRDFYRNNGLDIEPNWHMIFRLLQEREKMTVTEIAEAIHHSHPAVIKLINKMKAKGYIDSVQDTEDLRKYYLSLSAKAIQELPKLERYWAALSEALMDLMGNHLRLLEELREVEERFEEMGFNQRAEKILNTNELPDSPSE